jgi:23S rRNA (cytidine1920-2'-O)/16S rRNA (cytidine1409-2'-O)-methyltransferase
MLLARIGFTKSRSFLFYGAPDRRTIMKSKSVRKRLDVLLVERNLVDTPQKAQAMILSGEIRVNGTRADKAGMLVANDSALEVNSRQQQYASRGGLKLEGALRDFSIDPAGKICLDVGVSTGGFTDCLLQRGATRVYAVDVNMAQLAWKLRQDPRVIRIARNARELKTTDVNEPVDLVVMDVSFISAGKVLASASSVAKPGANLLIMVKPQFELPRGDVGDGGIVTDEALHQKAVAQVQRAAALAGLESLDARPSHLTGAEGNQEYFLHARKKPLG